MKKLLCKLGFHSWKKGIGFSPYFIFVKKCCQCGKVVVLQSTFKVNSTDNQ